MEWIGVGTAQRGRLHQASGPALAFRDGYMVYAWHGVRVPAQVIEHPETLTVEQITAESNAEVRRVMLERFGLDRYFQAIGAERVQAGDFGTLYKHTFPDGRRLAIVRVTNGSPEPDGHFKEYTLPVPFDCASAHDAVATTYGLTQQTYYPGVRT